MPNGLVAAPGFAFDDEPGTGFYRPAAGQLGVSISGASAGVFDANGLHRDRRDGTYTGTIALPAGARIIDIGVDGQVLWAAGTSASMIVGDDADNDGFFTSTNLKATDLLAGEINNLEHPGGKAGAYIASEQRLNLYQATARNVIGVVTSVGAGTAGRTRLYVVYAVAASARATVRARSVSFAVHVQRNGLSDEAQRTESWDATSRTIQGTLALKRTSDADQKGQQQHPQTYRVMQAGAPYPGAKPGDLLVSGTRRFYIEMVEDHLGMTVYEVIESPSGV
jgi:hypothetical protein